MLNRSKRIRNLIGVMALGLVILVLISPHHTPAQQINNSTTTPVAIKQPVEAPKPVPQPVVEPEIVTPPVEVVPQPAPVTNCGSNYAQQQIYSHESSCRTDAVNSIGCRGLGQACPGSKLPCSDYDWDCQNQWFTNYMINRYGSWENAWAFWQSHHWW